MRTSHKNLHVHFHHSETCGLDASPVANKSGVLSFMKQTKHQVILNMHRNLLWYVPFSSDFFFFKAGLAIYFSQHAVLSLLKSSAKCLFSTVHGVSFFSVQQKVFCKIEHYTVVLASEYDW